MKRKILVSMAILLGACATVMAQTPQELLNEALIQERGAGNLEQAIQLFQRVARESSSDRSLAVQGLMGAARSYQKLGQTAQSKTLYDEVVRSYADQKDQAALAKQSMSDTGIIQGTVVRTGTGEPVAGAKVSLAGGPVDPMAFAELQAFFKGRRVEIGFPPNGIIDDKFIQSVADAGAAQGVSLNNPGVQGAILKFQSVNDSRFHAISDSQGHFTIRNVLPGSYSIGSEREGYFPVSTDDGPSVATVTAGRTAVVEMPMVRGATISGRATDGSGQPLANTTVQAYSIVYRAGAPVLQPAVAKVTNEKGEYSLAWLACGRVPRRRNTRCHPGGRNEYSSPGLASNGRGLAHNENVLSGDRRRCQCHSRDCPGRVADFRYRYSIEKSGNVPHHGNNSQPCSTQHDLHHRQFFDSSAKFQRAG